MGRKGKAQKHTAKEIAGKHKAAKERAGGAGGGGKGAAERKAKMQKKEIKCSICLSLQPTFNSMKLHYESKHAKNPFPEAELKAAYGKDETAEPVKKASAQPKKKVEPKKAKGGKKKKEDLSFLDNY